MHSFKNSQRFPRTGSRPANFMQLDLQQGSPCNESQPHIKIACLVASLGFKLLIEACFVASLCLLIEAKAPQFVVGHCAITDSVSDYVLAWSSPELSAAPAPPLSLSQHLAAEGRHVPAVHRCGGRPHAGGSATARQQANVNQ